MTHFNKSEVHRLFADVQSALSAKSRVFIGYSGGLDSTVLLTLACDFFSPQRVVAVHINHGLSLHADAWQAHAAAYSAALRVTFSSHAVTVSSKHNEEATARSERYAVFRRVVGPSDVLLLGHHAGDQVETVLYNLLRGSGGRGLSGIPKVRELGTAKLLRPLLEVTRDDLVAFARKRQLSWVEDESNKDVRFDRNYLRHRVIPVMAKRWERLEQRIVATAKQSQDGELLAHSIFMSDLATLDLQDARAGLSVCNERYLQLDVHRRNNVIRHLPTLLGLSLPKRSSCAEVEKGLVHARCDASPIVACEGYQFRRYRQRIYVVRVTHCRNGGPHMPLHWHPKQALMLPNEGVLSTSQTAGGGLKLAEDVCLRVVFKSGGERCKPAGRRHSQTLKKLFQEYSIEPWWRPHVPLIYADEIMVAVGDIWVCEGWQSEPGETGLKIGWTFNSM